MFNWKRVTRILPSCGLLGLCIWQWLHSASQTTHLLDHHSLEQSPNFIVRDLQYRQYDEQGHLTHFLQAPRMHHIPKNDMHIFNQPHVYVTENQEAPWEIRADYGTAVSKGQAITLDQHVLIKQRKNSEDTVLKTEHLTYYPQQKKAYTSDDVMITQGGSHIHSKGLSANLADNHIHLHHARGRHERKTV